MLVSVHDRTVEISTRDVVAEVGKHSAAAHDVGVAFELGDSQTSRNVRQKGASFASPPRITVDVPVADSITAGK